MALSGAAIFAVYVAGYARTQAAADQWQTTAPHLASAAGTTVAGAAAASGAVATPASGASASPSPSGSATTPPAAGSKAASGADCVGAGAASATVAPAAFRDRFGDDGRRERGRERRGDDGRAAGALPAPQAQTPCPPAAAQGSGAAGQPAHSGAGTPASPATAPGQAQGAGQTAQAPKRTAPAATASASSPYKDGVYSGTGWSRHGSVSVALTVKGGKITSIVVTGCTTHYPCADVAPMPGEVLAAQSLQVDVVSGATDSSIAFLGAVQQALTAAQAAKG